MEIRRTLTMNWDGLGDLDDDEDLFFDAQRLSAVVPEDMDSSSSDEEFDDSRMSFSSSAVADVDFSEFQSSEYDMWLSAPESIVDRRRRLLKDMGLGSSKNLSTLGSLGSFGSFGSFKASPLTRILSIKPDIPPPENLCKPEEEDLSSVSAQQKPDDKVAVSVQKPNDKLQCEPLSLGSHAILSRSMSGGSIDLSSTDTKGRMEEMLGSIPIQRLTRSSSAFSTQCVDLLFPDNDQKGRNFIARDDTSNNEDDHTKPKSKMESIMLIKNLDNGNSFMVKECHKEGNWDKLNDVKTGNQITMEEFEKNAGHSPKVKELMRKESGNVSGDRKLTPGNSSFHKSFKKSKKKGASLFRNMKIGTIGASKTDKEKTSTVCASKTDKEKTSTVGASKTDKEKTSTVTSSPSVNSNNTPSISDQKPPSQWLKARVHGKPYKEFTALHMSQEIQGHDGSVWSMKFTHDGLYLASAGEDKVICIWEVLEFDVMAMRGGDDSSLAGGTPAHPMAMVASPDGRPPLPEGMPEKKKKGKKKKGIPEYVHVPETVFGLSETPFCTLNGHTDDVLDLSWSRSRLLLSSSMDKTVRLWDIETKNCLKQFPHTDYVTCIQFNPADNDYFISGSLDNKVRMWSIPDPHVVDWVDLHEMVTAVGYSNDGKVSVVGSNKGVCRFYDTADCKLEFKEQIELKTKKKPQPKKITGFQFSTSNPSEVLVTSADSRVRILDGAKLVQKFKGFKNNNSQLLADYSPDGKYIISASEDSQVYIWRHEQTKGKQKYPIITSYEHFPCKEVSVATPWPGSSKFEQPLVTMHSKKHSKRSNTALPPQVTSSSPIHDDISHDKPTTKSLPPVPKKNDSSTDSIEDTDHHENEDSSIGPCESFNSAASSSGRFSEIASPSPNSRLSPGWGGTHSNKTVQATAWGLVIVTAGSGGVIKVFQNVGLPFKVGRL